MNKRLLFLFLIPFSIFFISFISADWTLDACTEYLPSSDPNIDEGNSFTQTFSVTTSGGGGGWGAPNLHARMCYTSGCSNFTDTLGTGGLSTADTNPQSCNNACKNAEVNFTFTIDGNDAGDYVIDGRCESGIGDLNTADQAVTVNSAGNTAPTWSNNQTNGTQAGDYIEHSVLWADDSALSGYIFSWNNGSGTFTNDSFVEMTGVEDWSNISKVVNTTIGSTISWLVYSNDSVNLWNNTDTFQYTTTMVCDFAGTVKDGSGTAIPGAFVFIMNQSDNITYFIETTDGSGLWSRTISVAGNYTVSARNETISFGGDIKPWVECDI